MDFGGLLLLGLLWLLFNFIGRGKQQQRRPPGRVSQLPSAPRPGGADPTQREGSRLEALLREFERALEQAGSTPGPVPRRPSPPAPRRPSAPLPSAEEVEERESLEAGPVVVSLEQDVTRPDRRPVSQDDEADLLVARRIAAAEARSGPLTRADHARFDQRIRQEPADATAVRTPSPEALRRAVVWRELLGPPVALRESEDAHR